MKISRDITHIKSKKKKKKKIEKIQISLIKVYELHSELHD